MHTRRLMGIAEIRRRLGGISRERAHQIVSRDDFPRCFDELTVGQIWLREDVERWLRERRSPWEEAAAI